MPLDPARIAEIRAWLEKSSEDLRAADFEMTAAPPLFEDVLFHTQQAAEKVMKAFLVLHDVRFRKTHDLSELGRQCMTVDASLASICHRSIELSVYAWVYRYPGDPEPPTRDDAIAALQLARAVFDSFVARLPVEARV